MSTPKRDHRGDRRVRSIGKPARAIPLFQADVVRVARNTSRGRKEGLAGVEDENGIWLAPVALLGHLAKDIFYHSHVAEGVTCGAQRSERTVSAPSLHETKSTSNVITSMRKSGSSVFTLARSASTRAAFATAIHPGWDARRNA
jgi:hypothetical protein